MPRILSSSSSVLPASSQADNSALGTQQLFLSSTTCPHQHAPSMLHLLSPPNPHMCFWSLARSRAMRWHLRLGRWGRQICSCIVLSEQWACALPAARQAGCTWNFVKEFMVKAWVQVAEGWQALDNMWAGGWVCGDGGRCRQTLY